MAQPRRLNVMAGVVVIAIAGSGVFLSGQTDKRPLTFGFYFVAPCGAPHSSRSLRLSGTSSEYCLDRSVVSDQTDVVLVSLDQNADGIDEAAVVLIIHHTAELRVYELTHKRIGALVGVVLNGRLVSVAPITGDDPFKLRISGLTPSEAEAMVDSFGTWARFAPPPLPPG